MLSDNKVIEILYMADDFCKFFNETVKNIPLTTKKSPIRTTDHRQAFRSTSHLPNIHAIIQVP